VGGGESILTVLISFLPNNFFFNFERHTEKRCDERDRKILKKKEKRFMCGSHHFMEQGQRINIIQNTTQKSMRLKMYLKIGSAAFLRQGCASLTPHV
jgi:hypothetical protein